MKKSDGIDRFFCHYADDKIFPDEFIPSETEKKFILLHIAERTAILQKNYDMGNTFEGMFALMQKVKFSLAFRISTHPHWYTDKAIPLSVMNQPGFYKDYQKTYKEECFAYWKARLNDKYRAEANGNYWLTVHNSTYDIEKKMFRVIAQERYKKTFEFYLEE